MMKNYKNVPGHYTGVKLGSYKSFLTTPVLLEGS